MYDQTAPMTALLFLYTHLRDLIALYSLFKHDLLIFLVNICHPKYQYAAVMFEETIVSFEPGEGFSLIGVDLVVDEEEYSGVHIAAETLASDFAKVTKKEANNKVNCKASKPATKNCIFIGTLSQSPIIQALKAAGRINTCGLDGKWESWMTVCVSDPFGCYKNALVIVGSDKRGAIYGAYSLSEQIGISP